MSGSADVVVVGGGVIGLSIAYLLAGEGVKTTVLDSGPIGRQASWAGAGIVSPGGERPGPLPASRLRALSARLHAEWSEALRAETGIDNGYRRCGGVDVALTADDEADLASNAGRWRDERIAFERLLPSDFAHVEPSLGPDVRLAYYLPDMAQIRNPWHMRALEAACRGRGVTIRPGVPAEGFARRGDRVESVATPEGPLPCDRVVLAAGAWSGRLLQGLGLAVPTPPVRGQIVLLRAEGPRPRRVVEWGTKYLVPRDDGRILIGSTEEDAGFVAETTEEAIASLRALAVRLCPSLADAPMERAWAGLRPGSRDTRPYVGPAPGFVNLWVATGHKRAGLQLSTGTAAIASALVLGRTPPIDPSAFRLDRPKAEAVDAFRS